MTAGSDGCDQTEDVGIITDSKQQRQDWKMRKIGRTRKVGQFRGKFREESWDALDMF